MKANKESKKSKLVFFSAISIVILLLFSPYLFLNRPFILVNDQVFQFNLYYREWTQLIKDFFINGNLPFYSWYKFLGSDFYSSNALYTIGDIFYPFLLILFKNISKALFVETIIMVYISAYSMKYYLLNKSINNTNIIFTFSILYSISGVATLYFGNYMFHRFYAFMPLLFAGVDLWINRKNPILFSVCTFYLLLQNYYLMFTITAFLPIYFTITYLKTFVSFSFKKYITSALKLITHYIIGFMLSAFLTLPSILNLLGSQRLSSNITDLFWEIKVMLGYIFSYIAGPFPIYTDIPNIFQAGYNGHAYWYSMYTASIVIFVLVGSLFSKNSFCRKLAKEYWLISSITLLILPVNSVFHGFSEPSMRVTLPFVFLSLVYTAQIIDRDELKFARKGLVIYGSVFAVCLLLISLLGYLELKHSIHLLYLVISFLISTSIVLLEKKIHLYIILLVLIIESTSHSFITMQTLNKNFYWHNPNFTQEYVDYLQEIDNDLMFRIYVNPMNLMPTSVLNLNQSLEYHFMTTTTYDSMYEPNLNDFLMLNGFNWHIIDIDDPIIHNILGVKYYAVIDDDELPSKQYEYVTNLDHYSIYLNPNYSGVGFTYSEFIPLSKASSSINWETQLILADYDFNTFKNIESSERSYLKVIEKNGNYMKATIEVSNEAILFISIPYNKGWSIKNDSKSIDALKVQGGFIGLHLEPGSHTLTFNFIPYGFKLGLFLSFLGIVLFSLVSRSYVKTTKANEEK